MRYISIGEILELHRRIVLRTGGASALRDLAALESAVAQPRMTFGGQDLYPDLATKAGALANGVYTRSMGQRPTQPDPQVWHSDPGILGGTPVFVGTRVPVQSLFDYLEYLAGGTSERDLIDQFPALTSEHSRAALAFAAARERRLASGSAA